MTARFSGRAFDQVLNSASSAVFSLGLVAATDNATLGAVAIQMTAMPLLLGLARTSIFEGVLFRATHSERAGLAWMPAVTGLTAGTIAFSVSLVVGLLLDLPGELALATAFVTFAVLWFDGLRFAAFTVDADRLAVRADIGWLTIAGLGMITMILGDGLEPATLAWWYGGAAVVGSVAFLPLSGSIRRGPIPSHVRGEFKFGLDFLLQVLPGQLTLVLASLVTSLSAVGVLRASVTIFSPLATLIYAIRLTLIDSRAQESGRMAARAGGIYGIASVIYGVAILVGFSSVPGATSGLLGSIPVNVLALVGLGELARHVSQSAIDLARVQGRFRSAMVLRASQATALVLLSVGLAALWDAVGLGLARSLAFGLPTGVAIVAGLAAGYYEPALTKNPTDR